MDQCSQFSLLVFAWFVRVLGSRRFLSPGSLKLETLSNGDSW